MLKLLESCCRWNPFFVLNIKRLATLMQNLEPRSQISFIQISFIYLETIFIDCFMKRLGWNLPPGHDWWLQWLKTGLRVHFIFLLLIFVLVCLKGVVYLLYHILIITYYNWHLFYLDWRIGNLYIIEEIRFLRFRIINKIIIFLFSLIKFLMVFFFILINFLWMNIDLGLT